MGGASYEPDQAIAPRDGIWGRASALLSLAIIVIAAVVVAWPTHGAAGSGTRTFAHARSSDGPSRRQAVAVAAPHSPAVAQATDRVTEARAVVNQFEARLAALHATAYQQHTEVLPAAAADYLDRTRTARYADVAAQALTVRLVDAEHDVATAEQQQQQALADYFAALAAAAQAAERIASEQTVYTNAVESGGTSTGSCAGDVACFLACTRAHESDSAGGYQAISPDGVYRGAYQFDEATWSSVASSIGRGDLIGTNPASASPLDQDTLATALYEMRGNEPWGGRC